MAQQLSEAAHTDAVSSISVCSRQAAAHTEKSPASARAHRKHGHASSAVQINRMLGALT